MTKVSILGQEWTIQYVDESDDKLNGSSGVCYDFDKEIYVAKDLGKKTWRHVLKHEVLRAYRHESGFNDYNDMGGIEVWVELITLQFDKIHQTYIELGLYGDTVDVTTLGGE